MTLFDAAGLAGAALFLIAYGAVTAGRLDAQKPPALLMNLAGAALMLISLVKAFNLAAFLLELAWGLIALAGLVRLALQRLRGSRGGGGG